MSEYDHLLESDPDPPRFEKYEDVGVYVDGPDHWEWATDAAENLREYLKREGEATDADLIQRTKLPDWGEHKNIWDDDGRRPYVFYLEIGPVLATHDAVEFDAWTLTPDAPEPGTEAFREAAAAVEIPSETRMRGSVSFSTDVFAGFIGRCYEYLSDAERPVSAFELEWSHPPYDFTASQLEEALGYLAEIESVRPPESDAYGYSALARNPRRYARALENMVHEEERDEIHEWLADEPVTWRYSEPDAEADAEAEVESHA